MLQFLRKFGHIKVLKDSDAFWRYADATQRIRRTADGPEADAEEQLDLRAGQAIKAVLEHEVGAEEGPNQVQMQNWDWNDDRCRAIYILRDAFKPDLIPKLQALLTGEFADFQIIILLLEGWNDESWGHIKLSANHVAIQRNVAQSYAIAA